MSDHIEKQVLISAPRSRVWRALVDTAEFGTWFRVAFPPGEFTPGETVSGQVTYPGYEHLVMDVDVVEVVPEQRMSFRWVPGAEGKLTTRTLVTFTLADAGAGTLLKVVESGFDALPPELRDPIRQENDGGWTEQMKNIERHVTAAT